MAAAGPLIGRRHVLQAGEKPCRPLFSINDSVHRINRQLHLCVKGERLLHPVTQYTFHSPPSLLPFAKRGMSQATLIPPLAATQSRSTGRSACGVILAMCLRWPSCQSSVAAWLVTRFWSASASDQHERLNRTRNSEQGGSEKGISDKGGGKVHVRPTQQRTWAPT